MFTRIVFLFILIPFLLSCRTNNISGDVCRSAHSGKFIYNLYNEKGYGHWTHAKYYIERSENKEVEKIEYPISGRRVYKIQWITDCECLKTIVELDDWGDSIIAKNDPNGRKYRIVKVTTDYIIEKPLKAKADTLWFQK